MRRPLVLARGLVALAVAVSGCRGGTVTFDAHNLAPDAGSRGPWVSLRIEGIEDGTPLELKKGASFPLRAFARYANGDETDETDRVQFWTARPEIAAPQRPGPVLFAMNGGETDLEARLSVPESPPALVTRARVIVRDSDATQLVRLEIAPPSLRLAPSLGAQLQAIGIQRDGGQRTVTSQVRWFSANTAVCLAGDDGVTKGFVTGLQAGSCTVSALLGELSASAQVTVDGLTLTALTVAPAQLVLPKGQSARLTATATMSDGSAADATASAAWTSEDGRIASTAPGGTVTGVDAGTTKVIASLAGRQASAEVRVDAAQVVALSIAPPSFTLPVGLEQPCRAVAVFSDGQTADVTAAAAWSSEAASIASVGSGTGAGVVRGVAAGRTRIVATLANVTAVALVQVTAAELTSLVVAPAALSLPAGSAGRLRAIATYTDRTVRDVSADASWGATDGSIAAVSESGVVTGLRKGATRVTASLSGKTAGADITVTDAVLAQILVLPQAVSLPVGLTQRFAAAGVYSDNTVLDVTERATWATADTSVASVSNSAGTRGAVTAAGAGVTTLTAAVDGITSAPATISVTAAALTSVLLRPAQLLVPVYQTLPLRLFARYSDGSEYDQTAASVFTSDSPTVASVVASGPGAGQVTGLARGLATVTGAFGGFTALARLGVVDAVLQSITVVATRDELRVGEAQQLRAMAQYFGAPRPVDVTGLATWASSDPNVIRLDPRTPGLAVAAAPGTARAIASFGGMSGERILRVSQTAPARVEVVESAVTLPVGLTRALVAVAFYADGSRADLTYGAEWASDRATVALVGNGGYAKGLVTGVSAGTARITATVQGVSGAATVTVTNAKPVSVQIAPVNPVVTSPTGPFRPTTVIFSATATYDDGSLQNVTQSCTWSSSEPSVAVASDVAGLKGRVDVIATGGAVIRITFGALSSQTFLTAR